AATHQNRACVHHASRYRAADVDAHVVGLAGGDGAAVGEVSRQAMGGEDAVGAGAGDGDRARVVELPHHVRVNEDAVRGIAADTDDARTHGRARSRVGDDIVDDIAGERAGALNANAGIERIGVEICAGRERALYTKGAGVGDRARQVAVRQV